MNTAVYNNFEFTYDNHFVDQINKTESVIVYSQVKIIKGDDKFPIGEKIGQISILSSIYFENEDGSEYTHNNSIDTNYLKKQNDTTSEFLPSNDINWNIAIIKIYDDFEKIKNTNNCNKIKKAHVLRIKLENILIFHIKYVSFLLSKTIRPKLTEIDDFIFENSFFNNKPNLFQLYKETSDIRILDYCLNNYKYNITEIAQVLNIYEDLENIPEVEHIMLILEKYPYCYFTQKSMDALEKDCPETFKYIKMEQ